MNNKLVTLGLISSSMFFPAFANSAELTVYSSRNASYLKPLFDEYAGETGVVVRYLSGPAKALLSRMQLEGDKSQADIFFTTGAENLWQAQQLNLLSPVLSRTLKRNVPAHLKSTENQWFGLSKRARTMVYDPEVTSAKTLSTYQDLANSKWQGKLCLRTGQDSYAQTMVAMSVATSGEAQTKAMVKGWVANLAVAPMSEDIDVLRAVHEGKCAVGIVNSYYLARFKIEEPKSRLKLFWADQKGAGVQVNITGAGVTKSSKNKAQALDLIEWLSTKEMQVKYAKLSMEYPIHPKVYPPRTVAKWGKFKEVKLNVAGAGEHLAQALKIIAQTSYK